MNSRADRRRQRRAEALRAGNATSEAQLLAARGSEASSKTKVKRRKCYICGKYGPVADMLHGGYGRVMYSEAHFAHKTCVAKEMPLNAAMSDCAGGKLKS